MASAVAFLLLVAWAAVMWLMWPRGRRGGVYQGAYADYLSTAHWARCRRLALARDGYRCRRCGSTQALEIHHRSYAYPWHEHEHLEVLETLCSRCHARHHGRSRSSVLLGYWPLRILRRQLVHGT